MYEHTYTKENLEQTDNIAYRIMRLHNIQEVINILIPEEPPTNDYEYKLAGGVFVRRIVTAQPSITDLNTPPEIAYRVAMPIYPPLVLLGHHARVAILNIALENYESGLGYVVSMQETACQFGDDNILISTAKLGFGIMAFLVPQKSIADILYKASLTAQIPVTKKGEPCVTNHSPSAVSLCRNLYEIIVNFAVLNDGNKEHRMTDMSRTSTHLYMNNYAEEIDKATNKKFRMREWVNDTVKSLGYSTGVK